MKIVALSVWVLVFGWSVYHMTGWLDRNPRHGYFTGQSRHKKGGFSDDQECVWSPLHPCARVVEQGACIGCPVGPVGGMPEKGAPGCSTPGCGREAPQGRNGPDGHDIALAREMKRIQRKKYEEIEARRKERQKQREMARDLLKKKQKNEAEENQRVLNEYLEKTEKEQAEERRRKFDEEKKRTLNEFLEMTKRKQIEQEEKRRKLDEEKKRTLNEFLEMTKKEQAEQERRRKFAEEKKRLEEKNAQMRQKYAEEAKKFADTFKLDKQYQFQTLEMRYPPKLKNSPPQHEEEDKKIADKLDKQYQFQTLELKNDAFPLKVVSIEMDEL